MHNKIDFINQTDYKANQNFLEFLEKILEKILRDSNLCNKQCELLLVDNPTIQALNCSHRNKDMPTDVLSFPLESEFSLLLGSIVISLDFVKSASAKLNHSLEDEIALLFIHGALHLIGFDHEIDNGEHRTKEEEIIAFFNLPKSLITRNS